MAPFSSIETPTADGDFTFDDGDSMELCSVASSSSSSSSLRSSLKSTASTARSNTSVTFSESLTVHPILHILDFSLAEKRDSWLNVEDMRLIRREWKEAVQTMEMFGDSGRVNDDSSNSDTIENCVRGLEGKTFTGKRRRQEARALAMEAVLDEQAYQVSHDAFSIATAYSEETFPLHMEAFRRAQKDALAVEMQLTEEVPTKFDFHSVRASFYSTKKSAEANGENRDDDATVCIYEQHSSSSNKDLLKGPSGFSFRSKLNCLLPIAPKQHRRTAPRRRKSARFL
ncbi:MAG: hypothetical protein SGILL_006223 [Bacillariaceae sp.]